MFIMRKSLVQAQGGIVLTLGALEPPNQEGGSWPWVPGRGSETTWDGGWEFDNVG